MGVKTNANSELSFRIVILFYIFSIFDEVFGILEPGYLYMVMVEDEPPNPPAHEPLPALQDLNPPPAAEQEPEEEQVEAHAEENVEEPLLHPCVICLVEEANHAAAFCGHISICESCTNQLMNMERNNCLICRSVVVFYLKVYFS